MTALKTLLDTDILPALMRQDARVVARANTYLADHAQLTFSAITRYEILRGLKARNASMKLRAFEAFCAANEVLSLSDAVIVRASEIYADLYQRGQLIPDADILIAATAQEAGLVLSTNNLSDFGRVSGLSIDNWQS